MARFPLAALLVEVFSLLSLQQQLLQYLHTVLGGAEDGLKDSIATHAVDCLIHRGESGKWVQDLEQEKRMLYEIDRGFGARSITRRGRQRGPFQRQTTWRWDDDSGCEVKIPDKISWCKIMSDLNISRLYMAGESDMVDFSKSLRSFLSEPSDSSEAIGNASKFSCGQSLVATELHQFPFDINCEPSFLNASDSGRNLVVVNIGANIQKMEDFKGNLTEVMEWIDEWRGPHDIIFFRSIVPNRKICAPRARLTEVTLTKGDEVAPFATDSERTQSGAIEQSSDLQEAFNEYARQLSAEYRVRYLNVYKSTVLQNDGHPTNAVHCEGSIHSEQIDWWIDFLYSSLLDVKSLELRTNQRLSAR